MASVKAIIDINDYGIGKLTRITSNHPTNNASKHPHTNEIKVNEYSLTDMEKNNGFLVIPYNKDTFQTNGRMTADGKYNGYMWGVTDSNGYYDLILTFYGINIFKLVLYFDATANQYPTEYTITYADGTQESFTNDKVSLTILFQSTIDETIPQSILFSKWNRPNYNACLTFIDSVSAQIEMNSAWIESLDSQAEQSSDGSQITYGCLSNTGSISLNDIDGTLFLYAQFGYLDINAFNIKLFFNNKQVQYHIPDDSPYFSENNTFDLTLSNRISLWQNINFTNKVYESEITLYKLLSDIVMECLGYIISEVDEMLTEIINIGDQEMSVKEYMESIKIPAFTYYGNSLQNAINEICTIAQLNCIEDDNGIIKFYNARPIITQEQFNNILVITPDIQQEKPTSTILVSNRYDGVIIE